MTARRDKSNRLFHELAADFGVNRPGSSNTVCCPLCLREFTLDTIEQLSIEHSVPSMLGGQSRTLTCLSCNNSQGTKLDSHLIGAMKAMDSVEGTEPIDTIMPNACGAVVADVFLPAISKAEPITLKVIGKASHLAAADYLRSHLSDGFELHLNMRFRFIPERYWRAVMRSAYLGVFLAEGFKYVFSDGAARVREVLNGNTPVRTNMIMEAFPKPVFPRDILVMPHSFTDAGECFTVLLRLRSKRTRYLAVFLPGKNGCDWDMLGNLYEHATRLRIEVTPDQWKSKLIIDLGYDPISEFRKGGLLLKQLLRK